MTRFHVRAKRPKAGPFYGRACSRDRQLPGRQAALLFASPAVEERRCPPPPTPRFSAPLVLATLPEAHSRHRARSAVAPSPEDRLGARLPRGNAPFIHVSLIHRHARRGPVAIYDPYPRDGAAHKYTSCARTRLLPPSFLPSFFLSHSCFLRRQNFCLSGNNRGSEDTDKIIDFRRYLKISGRLKMKNTNCQSSRKLTQRP